MPFYRVHGTLMHLKLSGKRAPHACREPITVEGRRVVCLGMSAYLCDWETGPGSTCDRPLCSEHATQVGPDRHLCTEHAARRLERPEGLF